MKDSTERHMDSRTVGVAGLGLLGRGIAACLLGHGFRVIAFTRQESTHAEARAYIGRAIGDLVERAGFPPALSDEWPDRYVPVSALEPMAECEFLIESVLEDVAVKQEMYDRLAHLHVLGLGLAHPELHGERCINPCGDARHF